MIADTLHHAIEEIENYQLALPHVYDPFKPDIEHVKAVMDALRAKLAAVREDPADAQAGIEQHMP